MQEITYLNSSFFPQLHFSLSSLRNNGTSRNANI